MMSDAFDRQAEIISKMAAKIEQLQAENKKLETASRYFLAEYMDCAEKGRMSVDCDGAANALSDLLPAQQQEPAE